MLETTHAPTTFLKPSFAIAALPGSKGLEVVVRATHPLPPPAATPPRLN